MILVVDRLDSICVIKVSVKLSLDYGSNGLTVDVPRNGPRLRQCVNDELLIRAGLAIRDSHRDILFSVLAKISHWNRSTVQFEWSCPEFFSGFRVKRAELPIAGRGDEDQSSRRDDRATAPSRADILFSIRHAIVDAEGNLPRDIPGVYIHGG